MNGPSRRFFLLFNRDFLYLNLMRVPIISVFLQLRLVRSGREGVKPRRSRLGTIHRETVLSSDGGGGAYGLQNP